MEKLKTFQSGRKILSLCLSLCMILTVFSNIGLIASAESAYAPENFVSGSGTKDSPYEISTVGHLVKMVQSGSFNSPDVRTYYKLMADIDLNPTDNWDPQNVSYKNWASITTGDSEQTTFYGYLDGNGKTISHLYVDTGDSYENSAGLIQAMSTNSWIKNLTIDSFYSSGKQPAGVVGMVCGEHTGNVTNFENITVKNGTVISTNPYGGGVGGVLSTALAKATFNNCKAIHLNIVCASEEAKRGAICGASNPDGTNNNAELTDCTAIGCRGVGELIGGAKGNGTNGTVKDYDETVSYAGGSGTKADPYQIATADQLNKMVNDGGKKGNEPAYYVLKNDIVFNDTNGWSPDAANTNGYNLWNTPSVGFEGNFNGNGYTISNLYIKGNGFINEALDGAVITNVRFENVYVSGDQWVGTLFGNVHAITVSNVMIINSQLVRTVNWANTGGITGCVQDGKTATFSNCAVIKTNADGAISGCGSWSWSTQNITGCWAVECSNATRFCAGIDVTATTTKSYFITDKSSIQGAAAKENMPLDYTMTWKLGAEGEYPSVRAFNGEIWDGNKNADVTKMKGSGTKADPYIITDGAELYAAVNATGELYFEINNDIYLGNPGLVYLGVGSNNWFNNNGDVPFIGHIDGKGHTVYGLYSKAEGYWGASGFVRILGMGGTLKNIRISHSYFSSKQYLTGALTGMVSYIPDKDTEYTHPAEISGCSVVESSVIATEASEARIGALVGSIGNTYYADNSKGTVKLDVKDCYTSNNVLEYTYKGTTCDNDANAGGIIGFCAKEYDGNTEINNQIVVSNCYTDGNVPFGANASDYFNSSITNVYAVNVAEGIKCDYTVGSYGDMTGLFNAGSAWYQVGENPARLIVNTVDFAYPDFDGDGIDSAPDAASLTAIKKALLGTKGYNLNNAVGNCNGDQNADGVDIFNILDLVRLKRYLSNESGVELKKKQ